MPHLMTDVDKRYRGIDKGVRTATDFTYYSDMSLWDTYRTFHPLANLLFPDFQRDFLHSLVQMAEDGGSLPRWPLSVGYGGSMLGNSAANVFADAMLAGSPDFPLEKAYEAARRVSMGDVPEGKPGLSGLDPYLTHGYVPDDVVGGAVARTLEYSTNDACIAKMAEALGRTEDAAAFGARSKYYANTFDAQGGFFAPKNLDGTFANYSPTSLESPFVEGTAWHYLFMVPHDVPGLITTLGGTDTFVSRLEEFMVEAENTHNPILPNAWYYHGNEPDLLASFLFTHAGRRDLTAKWTAWIADHWYALTPGGMAGNDDGGTLSSWYVFAASGLYPLSCTGEYTLGDPLFDRVVWHLPGGDLVIEQSADEPTLGGTAWTKPSIPHTRLVNGAELRL